MRRVIFEDELVRGQCRIHGIVKKFLQARDRDELFDGIPGFLDHAYSLQTALLGGLGGSAVDTLYRFSQ